MARSAAYDDILLLDERRTSPARDAAPRQPRVQDHRDPSHRRGRRCLARADGRQSIESPGQSIDFIRLWVEALRHRRSATSSTSSPISTTRRSRWCRCSGAGTRAHASSPGSPARMSAATRLSSTWRASQALSPDERRRLWIKLLRSITGADVVYMKSVPQLIVDGVDLFAEMGQALECRYALPRRVRELRGRRQDAAQQIAPQARPPAGRRLAAMGEVTFERNRQRRRGARRS